MSEQFADLNYQSFDTNNILAHKRLALPRLVNAKAERSWPCLVIDGPRVRCC